MGDVLLLTGEEATEDDGDNEDDEEEDASTNAGVLLFLLLRLRVLLRLGGSSTLTSTLTLTLVLFVCAVLRDFFEACSCSSTEASSSRFDRRRNRVDSLMVTLTLVGVGVVVDS